SRVQGEEVDSFFQWDDPAVEQVTGWHPLAAEVVNDQDAPIGFYLKGCLVHLGIYVVAQVELIHGELAAGDHDRPAHPGETPVVFSLGLHPESILVGI